MITDPVEERSQTDSHRDMHYRRRQRDPEQSGDALTRESGAPGTDGESTERGTQSYASSSGRQSHAQYGARRRSYAYHASRSFEPSTRSRDRDSSDSEWQEIQRLREEIKRKDRELEEKDRKIRDLRPAGDIEAEGAAALQETNKKLEETIKNLQNDVKTAEEKTEDVQKQLKAAQETVDKTKETLGRKDNELKERDKSIRTLRSDLQSEVEKSAVLRRSHRGLEEMLRNYRKEFEDTVSQMRDELANTRRQCDSDIQHQSTLTQVAEEKAQDLQKELDAMQERLDQSKKLLDERDEELKAVGLGRTPRKEATTRRQLKEMVEALNHEILQTSSTIIDSLNSQESDRKTTSEKERAEVIPHLEPSLSYPFLLRLSQHRLLSEGIEEELGIQIALQATMAQLAYTYAQSWCPSNPQLNSSLQEIYVGLCKSEPLIARKWRSLACAQVHQKTSTQDIESVKTTLLKHVAFVLRLCGLTDNHIFSNEQKSEAIGRGIEAITEKITQLSKSIHEEMIQDEVELVWFKPGSEFVSDLAADDFSGFEHSFGCAMCTTELGVKVITHKAGGEVIATTLKAKVILDDVLYRTHQPSEGDWVETIYPVIAFYGFWESAWSVKEHRLEGPQIQPLKVHIVVAQPPENLTHSINSCASESKSPQTDERSDTPLNEVETWNAAMKNMRLRLEKLGRHRELELSSDSDSEGITRLREELRGKERRLQKIEENWKLDRDRIVNYKENIRELEEVLQSNHEAYQQLEHRFMEVEGELLKTKKQGEIDTLTALQRAQDLERRLSSTQEQLEQSKKLLEERSEETKAVGLDLISQTEVTSRRELKEMVESLNHEILQASSMIIDTLNPQKLSRRTLSEREFAEILPKLRLCLPYPFLLRLSQHCPLSEDIEENLGIQISLQAIFSHAAQFFISTWCPSNLRLADDLQGIYNELRKSDPSIATHWRSITHAQTRKQALTRDIEAISSAIRDRIYFILNICGWTNNNIAANTQLSEAIRRSLAIIAEKITQLNKSIHEDVIRDEVKILWFKPGSDLLPDLASDDFSGFEQSFGCVMCTTDIGVQITTPKSDRDTVTTALKSKVIMEDVLYRTHQRSGEDNKD
ncbi:hypothetical protein AX16_002869 [Volvariella volvacea WC 439]|nr:hypothetical protein AX16_002869 [Volvariella volvacea WC 439]